MKTIARAWSAIDRRPFATDAVVATLIGAFLLADIRINSSFTEPPNSWLALNLTLLLVGPLAFRRRAPLTVLLVMTVGLLAFRVADIPELLWSINAWWLALYSAGAHGSPRWRNRVRALAVAITAGWVVYELFWTAAPAGLDDVALYRFLSVAANGIFFAWVWWFGDVMRVRQEREMQLAERTRQLEREREENTYRAVLNERVRIARELHDVVAHHVSLMGVQAGAARRVLARQPEKAEEALTAIEATSRQAVLEMQRLLGFLRREEERDSLAPQPSMSSLEALVEQMRAAGLPVELTIDGEIQPLPPSVDLSAFRIVQEALTNTLKHAGPARAAVTIHYGETAIDVEIVDDGRGSSGAAKNGGNGLIGMRERVSLLGGRLQVGCGPGSGFAVRVHLPYQGRPT